MAGLLGLVADAPAGHLRSCFTFTDPIGVVCSPVGYIDRPGADPVDLSRVLGVFAENLFRAPIDAEIHIDDGARKPRAWS